MTKSKVRKDIFLRAKSPSSPILFDKIPKTFYAGVTLIIYLSLKLARNRHNNKLKTFEIIIVFMTSLAQG